MLSCVDRLVSEMGGWLKRFQSLEEHFGFLLNTEKLCYSQWRTGLLGK